MVIITSLGIGVQGPKVRVGTTSIIESRVQCNLGLSKFSKTITTNIVLNQLVELIESLVVISQITTSLEASININIILELIIEHINLLIQEEKIEELIGLYAYEKIIKEAFVNVVDKYGILILDMFLESVSRFHSVIGPLFNLDNSPIILNTNIELTDTFGPRLVNVVPPSGSVFNNPLTSISFTLFDQEHTTINPSGTNFYINGVQVISQGSDVTPTLFGLTGFNKVNDYTYDFNFAPSNPFDPDELVTVSGTANDTNIPINYSTFEYSFRVWKTEDLQGNILGTPDVTPPFLTNQDPYPGEVGVLPDSNIEFDVVDSQTGADLNSIVVYVNDLIVSSGLFFYNQDRYNVSFNSISGGLGYRYTIDPTGDFSFLSLINVTVSGQDRFTPAPNKFEESYSFLTYNNSHLVASGLEIYSEDSWELTSIKESYAINTSGVDFRIHYINTSGLGLDLNESSVLLNNEEISGVNFTEITPGYDYLVEFNIVPDYTTDGDLVFHVVQSGTISGVFIFNNYFNELLFGAEICYDLVNNFNYNTEIPVFVQVYDKADWPYQDSLFYKFTTTPGYRNSLYGYIVALPEELGRLGANIESNNPYFEYGKEMNMELSVKDFSGNLLNYKWKFKIEEG